MKKIVLVDDSRTARQQVRAALAEANYEIVEAIDGHDGLSKISSNADAALVLCDINMPNLNGLDMLTELGKQEGAKPPIVMLTTEAQLEMVHRAKSAGAKGWIVKPFKPHMLLAAVRRLVGDL